MQAPRHASSSLAPKSAYLVHCMAALVVVLAVILLFLQAPADGAFYWSDAPRHALNGVFIKDLLLAAPIKDPAAYAYAYYARYPALTVLFYPPLFYFLSAPLYLLLGVSHQTALLAVFLHYVAFGIGCYRLGLFWLRPAMALLFALVLLAAPEIAFWGAAGDAGDPGIRLSGVERCGPDILSAHRTNAHALPCCLVAGAGDVHQDQHSVPGTCLCPGFAA